MIEKINELINNGIRDGYDVDDIHEMFLEVIGKHSSIPKQKKKKKTKKVCRPVLLISDSSCDEFK
jgi:hypothetical protein